MKPTRPHTAVPAGGLGRTVGTGTAPQFRGLRSWELPTLLAASLVAILLYLAGGYVGVHLVVPVTFLIVCGAANWQMVRTDPASLWTPLFAYRTGALVFFGFGGFLSVNLSIEAAAYYFSQLTFTDAEAAKVFLVWLLGHVSALLGYAVLLALRPKRRSKEPEAHADDTASTIQLGTLFFLAGLGYYLLIELPQQLGFSPFGIIPNAISQPFEAAMSVGVFLISLWALDKKGSALLLIPVVVSLSALSGLISVSKQGVLLPVIFFSLAFLYRRASLVKIAVVATLLTVMFSVLQPMVAHARESAGESNVAELSLGERFGLYQDYFTARDTNNKQSNAQIDFLRFGHTHVASFIIDRYDAGLPSDEFNGALIALVPRIIWPDKPIVTQGAEELYYLVSGTTGSALAATVYADLYWNGGWVGMLGLSFVWGVLLAIATLASHRIVASSDWFMMPFVLLVFRMGLSVESAFVPGFLIPTVMSVAAFYLLRTARRLFLLRSGSVSRPAAAPNLLR